MKDRPSGADDLARLEEPPVDPAIVGRDDRRALGVERRGVEPCARERRAGLGVLQLRDRQRAARVELLHALEIAVGLRRALSGLAERGVELRGIEPREELALLHVGALVDEHRRDDAADLEREIDLALQPDDARAADGTGDRMTLDVREMHGEHGLFLFALTASGRRRGRAAGAETEGEEQKRDESEPGAHGEAPLDSVYRHCLGLRLDTVKTRRHLRRRPTMPPSPSPRAPSATTPDDGVRERILAAAVRAIEEKGLADVSMRDVARRAGVSHQLPYHYFTDREGTLAAVAEQGFSRLADRVAAAIDDAGRKKKRGAAERLAAAGREYVQFACEHPAHFRVMFRPDFVTIDCFPTTLACGDRAFAMLPALVQDCIVEGLPPEPSPQALAVLGWSIAHGLACLLLDGPLERKLPEAATAREELIREVMDAMRLLVEARTKPERRPKNK